MVFCKEASSAMRFCRRRGGGCVWCCRLRGVFQSRQPVSPFPLLPVGAVPHWAVYPAVTILGASSPLSSVFLLLAGCGSWCRIPRRCRTLAWHRSGGVVFPPRYYSEDPASILNASAVVWRLMNLMMCSPWLVWHYGVFRVCGFRLHFLSPATFFECASPPLQELPQRVGVLLRDTDRVRVDLPRHGRGDRICWSLVATFPSHSFSVWESTTIGCASNSPRTSRIARYPMAATRSARRKILRKSFSQSVSGHAPSPPSQKSRTSAGWVHVTSWCRKRRGKGRGCTSSLVG